MRIIRTLALFVFMISAVAALRSVYGQPVPENPPLTADERRALEVYRKQVPKLVEQLRSLQTDRRSPSVAQQAYENYLDAHYRQAAEMGDVRVRLYSSQIGTGYWVLGLVVLLSVSGVLFAGYQLYVAAQLGREMGATSFDVSTQRVQVTTSTVGIIVLVISGVFLLLFLHEVYRITPAVSPVADTVASDRN